MPRSSSRKEGTEVIWRGGELPRDLRSCLRSRVLEIALPGTRATSEPLAEWAQRHIRLDGKPFSFEGHAYLRALYDDTSPHLVLIKAAQVGGTTCAILKAIQACRNGLNSIYYFPTKTDAQDLSKTRVAPMLAENPFLARLMSSTDTVGLKRIGSAFLYFRGMQSEVGLKSVPADLLVFDELDEVAPDARARALERLAHSDYKRIIELSNPSLPGYGIDESYERSDQKHWTVRSGACNIWTALDCAFPTRFGE